MLETYKVTLRYQSRSCLYRGPNVRRGNFGIKANYVVAVDYILQGGFVANPSSLKPRPNLLYLKAQIIERNISCLVDKKKFVKTLAIFL